MRDIHGPIVQVSRRSHPLTFALTCQFDSFFAGNTIYADTNDTDRF